MKRLESIKNRPLAYTGLSIFALTVFLVAAPQYWIALTIAIAFCIVVFLLVKNDPILDIYEEFIVCHKKEEPNKVCVIPNGHIIYWQVAPDNTSVVQIYFVDEHNADNALCVTIRAINSYQVSNALEHYHRDKALTEIRRNADRKKLLIKCSEK